MNPAAFGHATDEIGAREEGNKLNNVLGVLDFLPIANLLPVRSGPMQGRNLRQPALRHQLPRGVHSRRIL
jgi:hypothetical protein